MPLPVSHFSSHDVGAGEQFSAWQKTHQLMFDVKPLGDTAPDAFPATASTYQLGNLLFGRASYAANRFERDERRCAEGLDVVMIRLSLEGEHRGNADGMPVAAGKGDIDIIDLMRPLSYETPGASVLVLGIPGRILETMLPDRTPLHGFVTSASVGMGAILGDYLRSLYARVGGVQAAEAAGVASATTTLVSACLRHLVGRRAQRSPDTSGALLSSIKAYIEEHLRSDAVSPETLCAAFGLSRATLYRLFSPLGGVGRYVRDRRLVAAFVALSDPARLHESVSSIAYELKFASEAHFGRIFRAAFGCTPGKVRKLNGAVDDERTVTIVEHELPAYIEWLSRLAARDR